MSSSKPEHCHLCKILIKTKLNFYRSLELDYTIYENEGCVNENESLNHPNFLTLDDTNLNIHLLKTIQKHSIQKLIEEQLN